MVFEEIRVAGTNMFMVKAHLPVNESFGKSLVFLCNCFGGGAVCESLTATLVHKTKPHSILLENLALECTRNVRIYRTNGGKRRQLPNSCQHTSLCLSENKISV